MAPIRFLLNIGVETLAHSFRRNVPVDSGSDASPAQTTSGDGSAASHSVVYLGLGLGVGGAFLLGLTVLAIMIVMKRAEHQRMIEPVEVEHAVSTSGIQQPQEIPRPSAMTNANALNPLHARAGWGALSSNEAVNEQEEIARTERRKRSSMSLSKKLRKRAIPLKKLKRLTAILESPRSRATASPQIPDVEMIPSVPGITTKLGSQAEIKAFNMQQMGEDDVFVCPGSPKPHVLPSFAIRSPGRYGAGIANGANRKAHRSQSVGTMPAMRIETPLEWSARTWPTSLHARSVSLGAPPTRPPPGPVPPPPVINPHDDIENQDPARKGFWIPRMCSSSRESSQSSVLVATPMLIMPEQKQAVASPTVEDVVAEDESASLKTVPMNQWYDPRIGSGEPGCLTQAASTGWVTPHTSVRVNIARYSAAESLASRRMSCSISENRLSITCIDKADQMSISRVSSSPSLHGGLGVRKVTTPRKLHRTSVSASGSPVERKKTNILREIPPNSLGPSRQPSNATQNSNRSSNGNPFQWDTQPLARPSALKGSPNARKGHRRQNCVRISTLTPQILGPPPSRSTSPIMHGIEEESGESGDSDDTAPRLGTRFVSSQRLSKPPSASSFAPSIRVQSLRESLTPSSPSLSAWAACQGHGLPSQISESQLSGSLGTRSVSGWSNRSSTFSIPLFPSPVKAATSTTQLSRPIPEFYLSRPSADAGDERSSPLALRLSPDSEILSSPPLPISKQDMYDPAWRMPRMNTPSKLAYDPASPKWAITGSERSSLSLPFAAQTRSSPGPDDLSSSSRTLSNGNLSPGNPPVSPEKMPEGFQAFFDMNEIGQKPARACESLTSANASAIMARVPRRVTFPGAPVLAPPIQDPVYDEIIPLSKQRPVSPGSYLIPARPAPAPPMSQDNIVPSPLHIADKASPTGPRNQPGNSVLKNAMALRRMNSEITIADRSSRTFVQLGREASPLLPWIGSPDMNGSCVDMNDLFNFDFAANDAVTGAEECDEGSDVFDTLDDALAGIAAVPTDCSSSVWEDGERYWSSPNPNGPIGVAKVSSFSIEATPERAMGLPESPRSIQCTPRSLYDSDGFLKG